MLHESPEGNALEEGYNEGIVVGVVSVEGTMRGESKEKFVLRMRLLESGFAEWKVRVSNVDGR